MLPFKIILSSLPLLVSAQTYLTPAEIAEIEVMHMVPTLDQLHAAFPHVTFHDMKTRLEARSRQSNLTIALSVQPWRVVAGALAATGYYSLGPGSGQVQEAIDACHDNFVSGLTCGNKIATAATAHLLILLGGAVGGKQAIMYFWHAAAEQAREMMPLMKRTGVGSMTQLARRQTCEIQQLGDFASSARFGGDYGFKIAAKDSCYIPDDTELGYVQAIASHLMPGFLSAPALTTDFTIFNTATSQVLARYQAELDSVRTNLCPLNISGGDDCSCNGC